MEAVSYWDKKLSQKSPNTQREYTRYMNRFLEDHNLTFEQLYNLQVDAEKAEDRRDGDAVTDMVGAYTKSMIKQGYSNSTANMVLKSLKFFFDANKLNFSIKELRLRRVSNGQYRINREQILEVYRYCQRGMKLRNRALVLVAAQSGLRISDIRQLTIEQFNEAQEHIIGGRRFKIFEPYKTQKTGDLAHMILGEEALEAVEKYLSSESRFTGTVFLTDEGSQMTSISLTAQFKRLSNALGQEKTKRGAHSYRKNFKTVMETHMPEQWVKALMGKATGEYSLPSDLEFLEKYSKGYPDISIFGFDSTEINQMRDLRGEVERLSRELENKDTELVKRDDDLADLMAWRNGLESRLSKLEKP